MPQTIIKGVRDINDRLRAVAEASGAYEAGGRARELSQMSRDEIGKLVGQMEAEMRAAARELEFERAAALRDEIQQVRLRVLEEDASVVVAARRRGRRRRRCARRRREAATAKPTERAAALRSGNSRGRARWLPARLRRLEVTSVTVLPADEEPADDARWPARTRAKRARPPTGCRASRTSTMATTRAGWRAGSTARHGTGA